MYPPAIVNVSVPSDPTLWDVLTAIGTVGAVLVALALGLVEQRRAALEQLQSNERQRGELARLAEERDAARSAQHDQAEREVARQARGVAAWFEQVAVTATVGGRRIKLYDDGSEVRVERPTVTAVNHSEMPVFGVEVHVHTDGDPLSTLLEAIPVLAPRAERSWNLKDHSFHWYNELPSVSVTFRDANGISWRRDQDGTLERRAPEVPPTGT